MNANEKHIFDEAYRRGFSVQRMDAGHYVITSKRGAGVVKATPATLEGVITFLSEQLDRAIVNVGEGTHPTIAAGDK